MLRCTYVLGSLLLGLAITLGITGFGPLLCDLSVLVSLQAASSHTQTEDSAHTDSQREQLQCAGHEPVCLVPGSVGTCMCLIALFNRAATHVLRAFYSADVGIMNFNSPLDSIACCLMLVAGKPTSQRIFKLSATAQPDATCNIFLHKAWLTMHYILRRDPGAPAHTLSLAIALHSLF